MCVCVCVCVCVCGWGVSLLTCARKTASLSLSLSLSLSVGVGVGVSLLMYMRGPLLRSCMRGWCGPVFLCLCVRVWEVVWGHFDYLCEGHMYMYISVCGGGGEGIFTYVYGKTPLHICEGSGSVMICRRERGAGGAQGDLGLRVQEGTFTYM